MNKTYRKIVLGVLIVSIILGGSGLLLKYGVFQGVMASSEERANTQCATEERVFDEANVITDKQEEELRQLIAKNEKIIGGDIVLLTIREPDIDDYYAVREYAQQYYEKNKFGWDKPNGDGIIYVDNWATGYCWMCTTGKAAEKLDDDTIQYIIDRTNETVNANPYGAYVTMVKETAAEMQNFNLFQFHIKNVWLLAIAFVLTVFFIAANLMNNKGKNSTNRSTYVPEGGMKVNKRQDIFLRSHVSRVKIKTDHSSDGSSGGAIGGTGGHGGGGGRH